MKNRIKARATYTKETEPVKKLRRNIMPITKSKIPNVKFPIRMRGLLPYFDKAGIVSRVAAS